MESPESRITFGSGGGFTGEMNCHHLLENGQIFKQDGIKGTNFELDGLKAKDMENFFDIAKELQLSTVKMKQPGDLYYFIEYKEEDGETNRITWGHPDFITPENIESFYQNLCSLVRDRTIISADQ